MNSTAPPLSGKRIVITGATGLIGNAVFHALLAQNASVLVFSRNPDSAAKTLPGAADYLSWNTSSGHGWRRAIDGSYGVLHLAGEPLNGARWTPAFKQRLRESRIRGTRSIAEAVRDASEPPAVFISSSAVGYYGDCADTPVDESASAGAGFLAELCRDWEEEAKAAEPGTRVATVRTGLVLARNGGALPSMLPVFRAGLGGWFGNGKQWFPWIHLDDVAGSIVYLLHSPSASGAYNLAAPGIVTNKEFSKTLGNVLRRPVLASVPGWALRMLAGEFASALLTGQKVLPHRTIESGYAFKYPELGPALQDLLAFR